MAQVITWPSKNYGGASFGHCGSQPGHKNSKTHNIGMLIPVTSTGMRIENQMFEGGPEVTMSFDMSSKGLNKEGWWDQINRFAVQTAQVLSKGQTVVVYPAQQSKLSTPLSYAQPLLKGSTAVSQKKH